MRNLYWACALLVCTSWASIAGYKLHEYLHKQDIWDERRTTTLWRIGALRCQKGYHMLLKECKKVHSELQQCRKGI